MNGYQQGMNNYQQQGMNNNRQMGSNGYPQQGGTNGYQQQMGSNGYSQGPANGYGQNNRMGGLRPAPGNGMYHPNRKRNIIIGVISGVVVLTTVLLIILLSGSNGAATQEAAVKNYIEACMDGNTDKLLDAMFPSKIQKGISENTKRNLREEMSECNGQIRDLEIEFSSSEYYTTSLRSDIRKITKYNGDDIMIESIEMYEVSFEVMGKWYRPTSYFSGSVKNRTSWDDYSFYVICYKMDGRWYCIRD